MEEADSSGAEHSTSSAITSINRLDGGQDVGKLCRLIVGLAGTFPVYLSGSRLRSGRCRCRLGRGRPGTVVPERSGNLRDSIRVARKPLPQSDVSQLGPRPAREDLSSLRADPNKGVAVKIEPK